MTTTRTGTLEPIPGSKPLRYRGRLRLGDGYRPRIKIPEPLCFDEEKATEYVASMQKLEDAKGLLLAKRQKTAAAGEVVSAWLGRYFTWRKTRGFVVTRDVETHLRMYVLDPFGTKLMTAMSRDDIEAIVQRLDRAIVERTRYYEEHDEEDEDEGGRKPGLSWKTCQNIWSNITCAFDEACNSKDKSMRALAVDPTDKVRGPERGIDREKPFLFPSELAALLSCGLVPIHWRIMYAVAAYTGARANELAALYAADVDLEHRKISISKQVDRDTGKLKPTKTKRTRYVNIEPALVPVLTMLVERAGEGRLLRMPPDEDRADLLRRHLRVAGCTRESLYADDAQRAPVRFHSLRDTCLTFMAIRGDEPLHIQWCAGHTSFAMTEEYIAQARRFEAGFGSPFAPLPSALFDRSTERSTKGLSEGLTARNYSATPTGIEPVLPT